MEYEWLFLTEAYKYSYSEVMSMPCSRRHKQVKFREEVVRQRNSGGNQPSGGGVAPATFYQAHKQWLDSGGA